LLATDRNEMYLREDTSGVPLRRPLDPSYGNDRKRRQDLAARRLRVLSECSVSRVGLGVFHVVTWARHRRAPAMLVELAGVVHHCQRTADGDGNDAEGHQ
jgi:hypothetical protein